MSLNTNLPYTSYYLQNDLAKLNSSFEFLDIYGIGKSVLEKNIYCIKFGSGNQKVSYFASIHANESITTNLLIKFIEDICNLYTSGSKRILNLFSKVTFYIIPLVNPDGVDLVNSNNENLLKITKTIAEKFPDIPFPSGWKSNIRGVDLKNFQPFCKALHCLIYTALLVFPFSFIISSILINSSKFSVIEFNFEKLKYI